jgi:hypothetical protein
LDAIVTLPAGTLTGPTETCGSPESVEADAGLGAEGLVEVVDELLDLVVDAAEVFLVELLAGEEEGLEPAHVLLW